MRRRLANSAAPGSVSRSRSGSPAARRGLQRSDHRTHGPRDGRRARERLGCGRRRLSDQADRSCDPDRDDPAAPRQGTRPGDARIARRLARPGEYPDERDPRGGSTDGAVRGGALGARGRQRAEPRGGKLRRPHHPGPPAQGNGGPLRVPLPHGGGGEPGNQREDAIVARRSSRAGPRLDRPVPEGPSTPGHNHDTQGERSVSGRVLIVDDDRDMCRLLAADLAHRGFDVTWRTSADAALDAVGTAEVDAVVTDVNMAGMYELELRERIGAEHPDGPVTILTAFGSIESAIAAIRVGASTSSPS